MAGTDANVIGGTELFHGPMNMGRFRNFLCELRVQPVLGLLTCRERIPGKAAGFPMPADAEETRVE